MPTYLRRSNPDVIVYIYNQYGPVETLPSTAKINVFTESGILSEYDVTLTSESAPGEYSFPLDLTYYDTGNYVINLSGINLTEYSYGPQTIQVSLPEDEFGELGNFIQIINGNFLKGAL